MITNHSLNNKNNGTKYKAMNFYVSVIMGATFLGIAYFKIETQLWSIFVNGDTIAEVKSFSLTLFNINIHVCYSSLGMT